MRGCAFSYFSKPYFEAAFDEILRHAASPGEWADSIQVNSATPAWLRVIGRCEVATADRIIQFMNEISDLAGKERESMGFALKEILMNAMEYGGKFNRERLVEVSYVRGQRVIIYRVRDPAMDYWEELNQCRDLQSAGRSDPTLGGARLDGHSPRGLWCAAGAEAGGRPDLQRTGQ